MFVSDIDQDPCIFSRPAEEIARSLGASSVACGDGMVTWLAPPSDSASETGRSVPQSLGPHLYDGSPGIALLLAAVVAGGESEGDEARLSRAALEPLRRKLTALVADRERSARLRLPLGAGIGVGSFVYALTRVGELLDAPQLLADAAQISRLVSAERVAADRRLDVMGGSAGALLALLALHRRHDGDDSDALLRRAVRCGDHLLEERVRWRGLPAAWPGPDRPPLGGFAHGAAGIGLALLRLAEALDRSGSGNGEAYRNAALEGFAFERALFDSDAGTWLDPRRERLLEQSAWCHGAPGVALSRVHAAELVDDPELRAERDLVLDLTRELPEKELDHLCCGNGGLIEILAVGARITGRSDLRARARELRDAVEARGARFDPPEDAAGSIISPDISDQPCSATQPSLFLGSAGWAWAHLQLAHEGRLPSVLSLD